MRGRASKHANKGGEKELEKLKEEPHLSGAYIRSLVKQLSSSRIKTPMNPKALDRADGYGSSRNVSRAGGGDVLSENQQSHHPQQPQQPKKQVRRRLHTSRPYQERLLNMAEARREIVTALKFHRASMKQANEQQQQQQQQQQSQSQPQPQSQSQSQSDSFQPSPPPQLFQEQDNTNFRGIYHTSTNTNRNTNTITSYLEDQSLSPFSCPLQPNSFPWTTSIAPIPIAENLNLPLPNQPLGLNLSFHDFNLDTIPYHYNDNNPSIYSYSSQTSSSSHTMSSIEEEAHSIMIAPEDPQPHMMMGNVISTGDVTGGGLHASVGDNEIADIQSIGEQHQMEWNDTVNIVDSAWWFKFANSMEMKEEKVGGEDDEFNVFDEVMEFPSWMNANESSFLQQDNDCLEDYLQEPALPCMVIEEIDGMDGEWLA